MGGKAGDVHLNWSDRIIVLAFAFHFYFVLDFLFDQFNETKMVVFFSLFDIACNAQSCIYIHIYIFSFRSRLTYSYTLLIIITATLNYSNPPMPKLVPPSWTTHSPRLDRVVAIMDLIRIMEHIGKAAMKAIPQEMDITVIWINTMVHHQITTILMVAIRVPRIIQWTIKWAVAGWSVRSLKECQILIEKGSFFRYNVSIIHNENTRCAIRSRWERSVWSKTRNRSVRFIHARDSF